MQVQDISTSTEMPFVTIWRYSGLLASAPQQGHRSSHAHGEMLYPFYPEVDLLSKGMQWQGVCAGGNDTEYAQEGWLGFRYILVTQKWAGRGHSSHLTT